VTAPSGPRAGVSRLLTTFAIGLLVLDGLLLLIAGWDQGRVVLMGGGVVSLLLAGVMRWAWMRHQRLREEVARERQALADEAREMRELLRRK